MPPTFYSNIAARNETLQGFVTGFQQSTERFKASKTAPLVKVPAIKGNFPTVDISQELRLPDTAWDGAGPMKSTDLAYDDTDYQLVLNAIEATLAQLQLPSMPPENLPQAATRKVTKTLLLRRETRVATQMTTLTNYLSTHRDTLSVAGDKFSAGTSDPVGVAQDALAAITLAADTEYTQISAPLAVWQALAKHSQLTEMVKYVDGARLDQMGVDKIAQALGFGRGVNLDASWDSSNKGGTRNIQRVWGNHMIFQALDSQPAEGTSAHAVTLTLDNDLVVADSWEPNPWSTSYYAWMAELVLITNHYAGYLVRDVL